MFFEKEKFFLEEFLVKDDDIEGVREFFKEDFFKDVFLDIMIEKKDWEFFVEDGKEDGKEDVILEGIEKKDEF